MALIYSGFTTVARCPLLVKLYIISWKFPWKSWLLKMFVPVALVAGSHSLGERLLVLIYKEI